MQISHLDAHQQLQVLVRKRIGGGKKKASLGRMFPSVPALVEILACSEQNIRFSKLRMKCHIYEKVAFIKYLKFCVERGLITNTKVYSDKAKSIALAKEIVVCNIRQGKIVFGTGKIMPKLGHKSITVPKSVYDHYEKIYQKKKKELGLQGITSFSGYITSQLNKIQNE